ncbi:MAG: ferritin-like domain-containing protein [Chloroflexota bacterium]
MQPTEIVKLLNQDLEDEHAAIIQYLIHAYAMGEGEVACEIEAISRDEMRHLDWLAETIIGLGGTPGLGRGKQLPGGKTVPDWMKNDVRLEEGAAKQYREHIAIIDDSKIKRLLQRILSDEIAHHGKFAHFIGKSAKEGLVDIRGERRDETGRVLNWGIEHEYTVILQYLWHGYLAKNARMKERMEDQAINEMQHLGWLAEELASGGGSPILEHTEVNRPAGKRDMLAADIKIEKEVAAEYDRAARAMADPDIKRLLERIRDNERYHVEVFKDLLEETGK